MAVFRADMDHADRVQQASQGEQPASAPAPTPAPDVRGGIAAAYKKYLGRDPGESEYGFWTGNANYEQGIAGSPEAQSFAKGQPYQRTYTETPGFDVGKLNDPTHTTDKYLWERAAQERGNQDLNALVQYFNQKNNRTASVQGNDLVNFGGDTGLIDVLFDQEGQRRDQWNPAGGPSANMSSQPGAGGIMPGAGAASGSGSPSTAGQIFTDPATQQWEQLMRSLTERLNQPTPTWTPAQMELQQTQALDPLERQRAAQKQQTVERFASRGIGPGSGVLEKALQDIDQQFNQIRTTTQAGFATQAINREDQIRQQDEQRAMNAVSQFKQIPQYADQRLQMANSALTPANPYQLLALQNQIQQQQQQASQYDDAQNQQFWQWFGSLLSNALA